MTISRPFWGLKGPLCFFSYVHPLDNKYVHCPFCSVIDFFYYFLKITLNDNNLFHDLYLWAKRIFLTYLLSFDTKRVWVGQNNGYSLTNSNRILFKRINVYLYILFILHKIRSFSTNNLNVTKKLNKCCSNVKKLFLNQLFQINI